MRGTGDDDAIRGTGGELLDTLADEGAESRASEAMLARHLETQSRVADLSRRILALRGAEIERGIREHLATAAQLAGADRTRLIVMHPDASSQSIGSYDWTAPNVPGELPDLIGESGSLRWLLRHLSRGEVVCLESVDALPAEAQAERHDLLARGVQSQLILPVRSAEAVIGFHLFECVNRARRWEDYEITTLGLVGELLASTARRRHMEDALEESETRFRAIADHATELVAELDGRGCYRYASPSFERRLGIAPVRLIGRRVQEFMHVDDFEALRSVYAAALANQSELRAVHRLRNRDGSWRWFETTGRAHRVSSGGVRFFAIARDITERKAIEEAIERQLDLEKRIAGLSRHFLALRTVEIDGAIREALVEAAALAGADRCFLLSSEPESTEINARYEWCNKGITSPSGEPRPWSERKLASGQILNLPSLDALPPEADRERRALQRRGVQSFLSIPIRSGDRTIGLLGFESLAAPRTWTDHDITLLQLIGEILTSALSRKRAEIALRESESKLLQAQKLEAVGRLAGGIAHDFNNLLTVILGFSRPLLRELAEGNPIREDISEIHAAAERAAALTRQLLTFSRRQAVEEQVMDLNATLTGLRTLLPRLLGEDVELLFDLDDDLQGVKGNPHQFEQVVINLAVNARDAMPDGGVLKISTRNRTLDAPHARRIGLRREGAYVLLSVSDSGHGMDADTRAQIFDPFFTTKEPGKGTGLGLSIAYSVVEQAGGVIQVEGGPSKGTSFDIWLPSAVRTEAEAHPVEAAGEKPAHGCVLLVEDEPALRRLASRMLEGQGYRVLEAADGGEALDLAAASSERIDALVTDVVMPRMGGVELARRLRAEHPALGLVFMSGYPEDRGRGAEGLPENAVLLEKPFRSDALLAKLREALERTVAASS
jgi:PAS domain S-box-containing protein